MYLGDREYECKICNDRLHLIRKCVAYSLHRLKIISVEETEIFDLLHKKEQFKFKGLCVKPFVILNLDRFPIQQLLPGSNYLIDVLRYKKVVMTKKSLVISEHRRRLIFIPATIYYL